MASRRAPMGASSRLAGSVQRRLYGRAELRETRDASAAVVQGGGRLEDCPTWRRNRAWYLVANVRRAGIGPARGKDRYFEPNSRSCRGTISGRDGGCGRGTSCLFPNGVRRRVGGPIESVGKPSGRYNHFGARRHDDDRSSRDIVQCDDLYASYRRCLGARLVGKDSAHRRVESSFCPGECGRRRIGASQRARNPGARLLSTSLTRCSKVATRRSDCGLRACARAHEESIRGRGCLSRRRVTSRNPAREHAGAGDRSRRCTRTDGARHRGSARNAAIELCAVVRATAPLAPGGSAFRFFRDPGETPGCRCCGASSRVGQCSNRRRGGGLLTKAHPRGVGWPQQLEPLQLVFGAERLLVDRSFTGGYHLRRRSTLRAGRSGASLVRCVGRELPADRAHRLSRCRRQSRHGPHSCARGGSTKSGRGQRTASRRDHQQPIPCRHGRLPRSVGRTDHRAIHGEDRRRSSRAPHGGDRAPRQVARRWMESSDRRRDLVRASRLDAGSWNRESKRDSGPRIGVHGYASAVLLDDAFDDVEA